MLGNFIKIEQVRFNFVDKILFFGAASESNIFFWYQFKHTSLFEASYLNKI